jgi:hypothetical protein
MFRCNPRQTDLAGCLSVCRQLLTRGASGSKEGKAGAAQKSCAAAMRGGTAGGEGEEARTSGMGQADAVGASDKARTMARGKCGGGVARCTSQGAARWGWGLEQATLKDGAAAEGKRIEHACRKEEQ